MTDAPDEHRLVVYSDYVCPFCYLGKAAMERYLDSAADPPTVEWRVFDLRSYKRNPDGSIDHDVDDGKDDDYFAEVRENVARLKDRYEVDMTLDFSLEVDSWNAQQAALHVKESQPDRFQAFHDAVFDALWKGGRDVGDADVLADVAADAGLDPEEVRHVVKDERLEAELEERFAAAEERGVTGIPTFVYGDHAARGAIPPAQFERLVGEG